MTLDLHAALDRETALRDVAVVAAGLSHAGARTLTVRGAAGAGADVAFRIASLTKVFTSLALVRALHEAAIPLATPAIDLLPALAGDWHADTTLTVEQVLGQVTGLREDVDASAVAALGAGPDVLLEAGRLVVKCGNDHAPGARWSYYNGNYFLAGALLEAVGGQPYETALDRLVLKPSGLAHTGFDEPATRVGGTADGRALPALAYPRGRRPSGGLWSTAADLLTLGEHLLADRPLLDTVSRPRTRAEDPMRYGLGWALGPSGQMYLNGRLAGYRAAMLLLPDHGLAAVLLANDQDALPALARTLDTLQRPLTGDPLAHTIDSFAA